MQAVTTLIMIACLFFMVGLVIFNYFRRVAAIVNAENISLKSELESLENLLEHLQRGGKLLPCGKISCNCVYCSASNNAPLHAHNSKTGQDGADLI